MTRERELAKNTAILTFGKICTQFVSFFLLPLYTAVLSTSDYGTFDLVVTYSSLFLPLISWQLDQGLFRFLIPCRNDLSQQRRLFSTVFFANTIQAVFFVAVSLILSKYINFSEFGFLIIYVVLLIYIGLFHQFLRGMGRNAEYAVASFISASLTVILNVITLTVFKLGLYGLYLSTVSAQVITIVYMILRIKPWKYIRLSQSRMSDFKELIGYSLPLIPNNLAWWTVNASDRAIISNIFGVAANGIYTVANKFPNLFISFYSIFNLSWNESVSLHYNDKDRSVFLSETITSLFKLFLGACFGIVALMPFIFPIMINEKYQDAYPQIIILMYAMLFRVIVGLYNSVYVATKNTKKVASTAIFAAIINIVINLLFIRRMGLYAASISTLVAFASMAAVRCWDINKFVKIRIDKKTLFSAIILAVLLLFSYYLNNIVINVLMLIITVLYAVISNRQLVISGLKIIKEYAEKIIRSKNS